MDAINPQKLTIIFKLEEGKGIDTTLPNRDRAMGDIYEAIEKLEVLKNKDSYDLIQDERTTTYNVKVYY